jgi:hypothetical protein
MIPDLSKQTQGEHRSPESIIDVRNHDSGGA